MTGSVTSARMVLQRIPAELDRLSGLLRDIEETLETCLRGAGPDVGTDTLSSVQNMDLALQSIEALSVLLARMSDDKGNVETVKMGAILDAVPLRDMQNRLIGRKAAEGPSERAELWG